MNLEQKKLDLIEKIIKNDRKFSNNEDLYDDFFNETCKRSLGIINIVSSDAALEAYLRKIAATSIINVLKNSGRLRRTREGYSAIHETSIESNISFANVQVSYDCFQIQETPEEKAVQKDTLVQIAKAIFKIDAEEPEKQYLQLYKLRYDSGMTQKEISDTLELSQSEVSKRLFKLMEKVKQVVD